MEDNASRAGTNPLGGLFAYEPSRRRVLIGAGGLGLGALLAACTSSASRSNAAPAATGPAKHQSLTIGVEGLGTQTPDPHLCRGSGGGYVVLWGIGENLARRDLDETLVPNLATKWGVSADGLSWTFTLRDGVKMHDGSTFTAEDVKTAVERVAGAAAFTPGFAAFTASKPVVKVLDPMHVQIITSTPFATMLDDMPVPIPTRYYHQVGEMSFRAKPKAAGSFQFASQSLNASMTFERFGGFFDPSRLANFKTLKLQIIADEATRVAAMQGGSLDAAHGLGPLSIQQLRQAGNVRVLPVENIGIAFLYFNDLNYPGRRTPFNDIRVRQALSYAIDRQAIAKSVFKGLAAPTGNFWFPGTAGYDPSLQPAPYDPAKAKSLLRAAGYTSIQLNLGSKNADAVIPVIQELGQALQSYWQAIGVSVKYTPVDPTITSSNNAAKSWPSGAQIAGFPGNLLLDPGTESNIVFDSTGGAPRVNDPQLDGLVSKLRATLNPPSARNAAAVAVARYVAAHAYALPLVGLNGAVATGPNVREWKQQRSSPYAGPWWYLRAN
jgi:peptide/nickel transport system substrate-binding protein